VDISLALLVAALSVPSVAVEAQKDGQGLEAAIVSTAAVLPLLMRRQRPLLAGSGPAAAESQLESEGPGESLSESRGVSAARQPRVWQYGVDHRAASAALADE